ncbi:terpenoid cyclases/Protein prenyltransferase [Ascobolus immersus RN42]|uniref:Terpenoid cyclases/Protein prenyltransferase n=1 Tax=Ascobolus immersus RN42 TaxID=1160509 RepID=A0A3N4I9U4_ASCIM|nr:terpenoid cyclases/Protein prenyltransferase [Ascobolus immersus RN42]
MSLFTTRQIRYHERCLYGGLPVEYISTDLTRLALTFFSITALSILSSLPSPDSEDHKHLVDSIYALQHPSGGFRGSSTVALPVKDGKPNEYDTPTFPMSCFALSALVALHDDLSRVNREGLLRAIKEGQREDGGWTEYFTTPIVDECFDGGVTDLRFTRCAVACWAILNGEKDEEEWLDVDRVVEYLRRCRTFDGVFAEAGGREGHAGLTYCGFATAELVGRFDEVVGGEFGWGEAVRWLVGRQTEMPEEEEEESDEEEEGEEGGEADQKTEEKSEESTKKNEILPLEVGRKPRPAGFAGRPGKVADTCYSFWVGASLQMLKASHLCNLELDTKFLLEGTQSVIGGFTKLPGEGFPDLLHSFLGLAALGLPKSRIPEIKTVDGALCIAAEDVEWMKDGGVVWWRK